MLPRVAPHDCRAYYVHVLHATCADLAAVNSNDYSKPAHNLLVLYSDLILG
jgi:hypothetical protein